MQSQLYFNPSCSKCRGARALLVEHGIEVDVVRYLEVTPTRGDLQRLMELLGFDDPRLMMRTGESVYEELKLDTQSGVALLDAIVANPILLERPILVRGERAVIGRPPERVLELL